MTDNLYVSENNNLTSLTGLENLTTVNGHATIAANINLSNLSGLNNLSFIGGNLDI